MDVNGATRFAVIASLLVLVQAGIPPALAHSQDQHGGQGGDEAKRAGGFPLTPDRDFADQRNPAMDGPRVVWQERTSGQDDSWDLVMANLSENPLDPVRLTNSEDDDIDPVVDGDHVAWTILPADDPDNRNLAVLDLETGRIHHVPDTGGDETAPTFGGNGSLYYTIEDGDDRLLRGFQPETGKVFAPIDDRPIVADPAAHGEKIAWAEGSNRDAKLHVKDTTTGRVEKASGLYNIRDGLTMGPAGVAFIARYGGEFTRGEYATLYNETTGIEKFRSHVYPHTNVRSCEAGVIWDQPGTSQTDQQAVALWDRHVETIVTFGQQVRKGTCGGDHLVYEKNTDGEENVRKLHGADLRDARIFRGISISMDDDDQRSVLTTPRTFTGTAEAIDPREPVTRVLASIDGSPPEEIETTRTADGLEWNTLVDPDPMEPGRHQLTVITVDTLNRTDRESFTFYTETPYQVDPSTDGDPAVPLEGSAPFPLNLLNHYQGYQPFYNTVLLVLLIIAAIAWYAYRRYQEEPTGTPDYVPPDEPDW